MLKTIPFLSLTLGLMFSVVVWAKPLILAAPFQQQMQVMALSTFLQAPYVIAQRKQKIYVRGLKAPLDTNFIILRRGISLTDPNSNNDLGIIANYIATVRLLHNGDPAVLQLMKYNMAIRSGDRLFLPFKQLSKLTPHNVTKKINAQIIATVTSKNKIRLHDQVVLNYGKDNGALPGQTFTIFQMPTLPLVQFIHNDKPLSFTYEKRGSLIITRSFPRTSFAIILTMRKPINILDHIISPAFEKSHEFKS